MNNFNFGYWQKKENKKEEKLKHKSLKIFPIALGILILSFLAYPQAKESVSIQGYVTDAEGIPLPGVTVTVESPNLIGGARSAVTDADGFYKLSLLVTTSGMTDALGVASISSPKKKRAELGETFVATVTAVVNDDYEYDPESSQITAQASVE